MEIKTKLRENQTKIYLKDQILRSQRRPTKMMIQDQDLDLTTVTLKRKSKLTK